MPDLIDSLHNRDLGHLRIVASLWGVELASNRTEAALKELAAALLDPRQADEVTGGLPAEARSALEALAAEGGRIPWPGFARRFGELREIGAGRRDREQIHLHPISAAETLFYRALLARAFFDTPDGPQEFAYIPEDLLPLIHRKVTLTPNPLPQGDEPGVRAEPLGRPATPIERAEPLPATDRILDDACTLLAALRLGWSGAPHPDSLGLPETVLLEFLRSAGLVVESEPQLEPVGKFLAAPRGEALGWLAEAWRDSDSFNELRQLPGLVCEGEWSNPPRAARRFLLDRLEAVPSGQWWSLNAFVRLVKEQHADFQRPAGDYDSWFIRRLSDGTYLRGFAAWDEVDGALIRYLVAGPLYWLGLVDLARPEADAAPTAFRRTKPGARKPTPENGRLHVSSRGRIDVPRSAPRAARYQVARFCTWEGEKPDEYRYLVAPSALKRAGEQGLKVEQLLALLKKYAAAPVPPAFVRAVLRWEKQGSEARLETRVILRLGSPAVLEELRKSPVARFLGEPLGPAAVIVREGAQAKVLGALAEMGLLAEISTDTGMSKQNQMDRPNDKVGI